MEYGFLCVVGEDGTRLYLVPHGFGAYQLISGMKGAAVFEKRIGLEMMRDNSDLFYVPVNIPSESLPTIRDPETWHEMNAPKSSAFHEANNN